MIEFILRPYDSPVEGVTNIKTGWKLTRDIKGLDIIEELAPSEERVRVYRSNIQIPINTRVYIWYKMVLSTGEEKDYVGPHSYESTHSNITNDIKPVLRVETPTIIVDEDSLYSGGNLIRLKSSIFRGDRLDGHLASTWFVKTPNKELIHSVINSTIQKYEVRIDKSLLGLGDYDYVEVGLKHHGANGSSSDFTTMKLDLMIYPFKYIGESVVDSTEDYRFSIKPYVASNPNLLKVKVVNTITNEVYIEFTDVSRLDFTIPAHTLPDGTDIRVESYVVNTTVGDKRYPLKLDTNLITKKLPRRMEFDTNKEYDFTDILTQDFVSPNVKGSHYLVDNKTYVLSSSGLQVYKMVLNNDTGLFTASSMIVDSKVVSYMSSDSKLFNLRDGSLLLVSRKDKTIAFVRINIINNNTLVINDRLPIRLIPCLNTNHYLSSTSVMDLTETKVYLHSVNSNALLFTSFDIRLNIIETLPIRDDLTRENYKPEKTILQMIDYGSVMMIGGRDMSDMSYEYDVKSQDWIPREFIDLELLNNLVKGDSILMVNKEALLSGVYSPTGKVTVVNRLLKTIEKDSSLSITIYNLSIVDNIGRLYLFNSEGSKLTTVKPRDKQ